MILVFLRYTIQKYTSSVNVYMQIKYILCNSSAQDFALAAKSVK